MATVVAMPSMGYDMKEGIVVRWRKKEGEQVARGEVIAEIETDKATVEMEAYASGVLGKILAEEGASIPVGDLIAVITAPGEEVPPLENLTTEAPQEAPAEASEPSPPVATETATAAPAAQTGRVAATPIARRLAMELGVDLAQVTGTGPNGRIQEDDVRNFSPAAPAAAPATAPSQPRPGERVELSRMRKAIAGVTVQSMTQAPHFYVTSEIDMTLAMSLRRQLNEALGEGARTSVNDLIVKSAALALAKHPKFNSSFEGDALQVHGDINVGIAVALEQGLIVPAVSQCQDKSLAEIAAASRDLIDRAHGGTLRAEEYTGGTFAVSNLGMFDVDSFTAIIFPPNSAVLAVGAVKEQPVVREGEIKAAQIMKATLSTDHRVADGAEAAQFLMEVKRYLENPVSLLL